MRLAIFMFGWMVVALVCGAIGVALGRAIPDEAPIIAILLGMAVGMVWVTFAWPWEDE